MARWRPVVEIVSEAGSSAHERGEGHSADRWLTAGVRGIGTASLLADLGHEVPTALLPSLLTSTLGAPASALGLIEGLADGLAGAARFAGGPLADDPQRRRSAAVGGYTATAVLSGLVGVATSAWQVGVLRAGAWAARGLRVRTGDGQPRRDRGPASRARPGRRRRRSHGNRALDRPRAPRGRGDPLRDPSHGRRAFARE